MENKELSEKGQAFDITINNSDFYKYLDLINPKFIEHKTSKINNLIISDQNMNFADRKVMEKKEIINRQNDEEIKIKTKQKEEEDIIVKKIEGLKKEIKEEEDIMVKKIEGLKKEIKEEEDKIIELKKRQQNELENLKKKHLKENLDFEQTLLNEIRKLEKHQEKKEY